MDDYTFTPDIDTLRWIDEIVKQYINVFNDEEDEDCKREVIIDMAIYRLYSDMKEDKSNSQEDDKRKPIKEWEEYIALRNTMDTLLSD